MNERPSISVRELVEQAGPRHELEVLAGAAGLDSHRVDSARVQKMGLALAGFTHYIHAGRVQLVGQTEIWFLDQLDAAKRRESVGQLGLEKISCVLVTKGLDPPRELVEAAEEAGAPLLRTPLVSSAAIALVTELLQEALAPRELRHGVLLEIHGLGVLIEGKSGVGKSECALDLVMRGHRLVSDDVVELRRTGPEHLRGNAPDLLREHMEIRGLGILNVRDLFGVSAISGPLRVGLSIRLERWEETREVERLGLDAQTVEILGVQVPHVLLPVSPGRNLSTLVEAAVRVHLLRARGHNAAQTLVARHDELMAAADAANGAADPSRAVDTAATATTAGDSTDETFGDGREKARR